MSRRTPSFRPRPPFQALESLEARINLSAAPVSVPTHHAAAPTPVTTVRYRTDALSGQQAAGQYGKSYTNTQYQDAQNFFNHFRNRYTPYEPQNTDPVIDPNTPDPTVTPDPDPIIPPPPPVLDPVTITQSTLGNFTRLTITGTSDNDSILVTQSGDTLTIVANGTTTTVTGNFTELAIYGNAGDDDLTVRSSVTISTLLYGGTGNNLLVAGGSAKSFIVSLGGGNDTLTGNGSNTSFWADSSDVITNGNATTIHRVNSFYQPFSSSPSSPDYIPTSLNGQNLRDPGDSGVTTRLNASLWGTGPSMTDINQGQVGDCYFLADLQSMALKQGALLEDMAVDLGDGTYAVQFKRNGVSTFVRVDGDLPTAPWSGLYFAHPTNGGALWAAIMEKAYAFFRTGAATYDSLNWGWTGSVFSDLGVANTTFNTASTSIFNTLTNALANNKAVAAISNGSVASGIPIVGSHAYTVVSTSVVAGVQYVTVRNPWGFDGAGNDGNTSDGLLKLTLGQFQSAFSGGSIQM